MIVYFSGTGNSRYCAQLLGDRLQDEVLDVQNYIRHGIAADLHSGKPWVFVSPTYAWQLPRVFADFIRSGSFSGAEEAYFVMTCGSDIGNAGAANRALCQQKGLVYCGTQAVLMPENYITMFAAPKEKEAGKIIGAARPVLEKAAGKISSTKAFDPVKITWADKVKSGIVNQSFYPIFVTAKHFYTKASCIGCGKCESVCPLGNIQLKAGRPVWADDCTQCMACIASCPTGAIEYGRKTKGKARYLCPDYQK